MREGLRDGSLTLSAAAELQWAFDRQRRRGSVSGATPAADDPGFGAATAGSVPPGATMAGDPEAGPGPVAPSSPADPGPPLVLDATGRQKLVQEATGKSARQVRRMLADLDPELAVPPDRVRPLGDGRYELKAVIDADCQHGLEHLRGLLSHLDASMTVGQLVGRLVQEGLNRHDPSRPPRRERTGNRPAHGTSDPGPDSGDALPAQAAATPVGTTPTPEQELRPPAISTSSPIRNGAAGRPAAAGRKPTGVATPASKSRRSGRAIPAAVRRQVWQRVGGRCSYVDRETGRRCSSRQLIEIDHILPYAMGGGADLQNLRLLCGAHHRQRHAPPGSRQQGQDRRECRETEKAVRPTTNRDTTRWLEARRRW